MNETVVITSERMAGWLMFNNCPKLGEKPDLKDRSRNVYIFKTTEKLTEAMNKYNDYKYKV